MKTYKIDGVILRTDNFGDADKVVTIFTGERGKLELNAYGCRRARSPMAGTLQQFNHISAEVKRGANFDTIYEADVIKFCRNLAADLERIGYASVFFEVVNRMTLPKQPERGAYELLVKILPVLDEKNARIAALIGVCQFMEFTGMQLSYSYCVNCGGKVEGDAAFNLAEGGAICQECVDEVGGLTLYPENLRLAFEKMLAFDWLAETRLNFTLGEINAAEEILWRHIQRILGKELNSVKFLRDILK